MKKFLVAIITIAVLCGLAFVTIPSRQDHKDAIMKVVNEKVTEVAQDNGLGSFGAALGSKVVGFVLDNHLVVEDHFVLNIGYFTDGDDKSRVSLGLFGHVFTISKEDLDKLLEEYGL